MRKSYQLPRLSCHSYYALKLQEIIIVSFSGIHIGILNHLLSLNRIKSGNYVNNLDCHVVHRMHRHSTENYHRSFSRIHIGNLHHLLEVSIVNQEIILVAQT